MITFKEYLEEARYKFAEVECKDCGAQFMEEDIVHASLDRFNFAEDPDSFCPNCGSDYLYNIKKVREGVRDKLKKRKTKKIRKDLAKQEDPLDHSHMAGHEDNGPKAS